MRWARISSSAPLKPGINRGLIGIRRTHAAKGGFALLPKVREATDGAWGSLASHPSALSHPWPPGAHERDAGVLGARWRAGSGASTGLPQGDGRAPLHLSPLRVGPMGALPRAVPFVHNAFFFYKGF